MSKPKPRHGLIAALDVGTTKFACFIGRAEEGGNLRVLGIGHQISRGIRNGTVTDMDEAEAGIRAVVEAAEQMAEERIQQVAINVNGGQPKSSTINLELAVGGHEIGEPDIRRLLDYARSHRQSGETDLIHAIPVGFSVDGNEGIQDPRGMWGDRLGMSVHLIEAASGPARNLASVVNRCHLEVEAKVTSAYAAGLACLVEDEKSLGVTCIDLGGGTTTIAVFQGGQPIYTAAIPIGGVHVTNDIARGLTTTLAHAERMKTLYGSALPSASDERETLRVPLVGEDEDGAANQIPRSLLVQIIQPRLEETFELVRSHLEEGNFDKVAGRRVVLTGGGSQIQGVSELAQMVLDKKVRVGRPQGIIGLPEATSGPAFAACAGLLRYAALHQPESASRAARSTGWPALGWFGRLAGLAPGS